MKNIKLFYVCTLYLLLSTTLETILKCFIWPIALSTRPLNLVTISYVFAFCGDNCFPLPFTSFGKCKILYQQEIRRCLNIKFKKKHFKNIFCLWEREILTWIKHRSKISNILWNNVWKHMLIVVSAISAHWFKTIPYFTIR